MRPGDREPDIILPHAHMDSIKIGKSSKLGRLGRSGDISLPSGFLYFAHQGEP